GDNRSEIEPDVGRLQMSPGRLRATIARRATAEFRAGARQIAGVPIGKSACLAPAPQRRRICQSALRQVPRRGVQGELSSDGETSPKTARAARAALPRAEGTGVHPEFQGERLAGGTARLLRPGSPARARPSSTPSPLARRDRCCAAGAGSGSGTLALACSL